MLEEHVRGRRGEEGGGGLREGKREEEGGWGEEGMHND